MVTLIIIFVLIILMVVKIMPARGINQVSIMQLKEMLSSKDVQFIDVRTPSEFNGRHIREFTNIPLDMLASKYELLSKYKPIVVICQSGMRSQQACSFLKNQGFIDLTNVRGGMSSWF